MPKVLIFGEYGSLNGGEYSLLATIPFLQQSGWKVSAAVPSHSDFSRLLDQCGVDTLPLWLTGLGGSRLSQEQIRFAIANTIKETQPDLVHANSLSTSRLLGPVAKDLDVPSCGHLRDIIKCSAQAIADINSLDQIIAVSQATANFHISHGLDPSKVRVVYNGVDTAKFSPQKTSPPDGTTIPIREELQLDSSSFLVLFVGQIGMRKGVSSVLQAMDAPIQKHSQVHLLMVGQRHSQKDEAIQYEKECITEANRIGADRVHWLGRRDDVHQIMQQSNLLIHLPRQEPLGRVLLEAASSGLPIFTTDVGGTREILSRGEFGTFGLDRIMVPQRDSFADCFDFDSFLSDPSERDRLSSILRNLAVSHFSDAQAAENLRSVYEKAIEK